ncbi:MAG: efflux RND transporter periplasmic adaptor subunit [Candidatus Marinimicrobia bacterium]|nr:efflux RND transporter periplasmic adaptor subunit [Candidatus Neomarinimicrobiota bacterium]
MKKSLKSLGTALFVIGILVLTSCGGKKAEGEETHSSSDTTATDNSNKDSSEETAKKKKDDLDSVPVETIAVWRGEISSYILLSSTIETEQYVDVYPYLTGIVSKLLAEEGDDLKKGDPLLMLDAEEYQLAEAKARTQLESLQSEFNRIQIQFDKDLLSKEEYYKAKLNLDQLLISWKEANLSLSRTTVRAPINGVVSLRKVRQGDRVTSSTHLFSMVNLQDIIATVHVPEKELATIKKGQLTYVSSDYLTDKRFVGYVKRISPVVNPNTGTFKVTIGLDADHEGLRPGMFVNTFIVTMTNEDALLLDKDAIVYEGDKRFVYVVRNSLAHRIRVEVGFEDASLVEIISGVNDSDKVIIVGQNGLRDKTKVKVVNERKIS